MSVYDVVSALGISLSEVAVPVAAYVPFVYSGRLLFLSGHIPKQRGKPWVGQLGVDMTTDEGARAARSVAIDLIGTLHAATGDLNRITRIVKLMVLVNSSSTFTEHHHVANGASELIQQVFGASGTHVRSAFGVAQIPLGCCVEIELIAEVALGEDRAEPVSVSTGVF
jgi:enamine deaminase RidA (YjgF/YER057c/UK114 family)